MPVVTRSLPNRSLDTPDGDAKAISERRGLAVEPCQTTVQKFSSTVCAGRPIEAGTEEAAILAAKLGNAFVAYKDSRVAGVNTLVQHQLPCFL